MLANSVGGQGLRVPGASEAADGYSRSWYLAAAAIGPDDAVAGALVAAADEARQRNGLRASARTLRRAAELTANPRMRAERLLQAAHDAHLAGDSLSAVDWCEQALATATTPASPWTSSGWPAAHSRGWASPDERLS